MRHPQHLGLLLVPFGIALLFASPAMLAALGWTIAATLLFIIFVEELECIAKFGEDYCRYMMRVPAFSLNPSCLLHGIRTMRGIMRRLRQER